MSNDAYSIIIWLAGGLVPLISQLGQVGGGKLSYCLLPNKIADKFSKLNFSIMALVSSTGIVCTPLPFKRTMCYLTIKGVGGHNNRINFKDILSLPPSGGNMILIDSGTSVVAAFLIFTLRVQM